MGQIIINSAENFCKAANQFFTSITSLFQKSDVIPSEPSDIERAPIIPDQEHLRFTSSHDVLPFEPEKHKSIFSSYCKELIAISWSLVLPKNISPKKYAPRRPEFRSSHTIQKHMPLLYGKHMDADEIQDRLRWAVYAMVSLSMLWTMIFWRINPSDRLVSLIFVLDLRLDNMFLILFFLTRCSL